MQHSWHQVSQILIIFQEYLSPETYDHIGYIGAIFIQFGDSIVVLDFFIGPTIGLIYYVDQLASVSSYPPFYNFRRQLFGPYDAIFVTSLYSHYSDQRAHFFSVLCLLQKLPVR